MAEDSSLQALVEPLQAVIHIITTGRAQIEGVARTVREYAQHDIDADLNHTVPRRLLALVDSVKTLVLDSHLDLSNTVLLGPAHPVPGSGLAVSAGTVELTDLHCFAGRGRARMSCAHDLMHEAVTLMEAHKIAVDAPFQEVHDFTTQFYDALDSLFGATASALEAVPKSDGDDLLNGDDFVQTA